MAGHRGKSGLRSAPRWVAAALLSLPLTLTLTAAAEAGFTPVSGIGIPEQSLFDVGATDYDGDGNLDLFTTNHKFHSALLHNDGGFSFSDRTAATAASPTPQFPGLEFLREPPLSRAGTYIYITDSDEERLPGVLHLRSVDAPSSGTLIFSGEPISVRRSKRATVDASRNGAGETTVRFTMEEDGLIDITEKPIDFPISVRIDPQQQQPPPLPLPIPQPDPPDLPILVGSDAVEAMSEQFLLRLRDRHGYAFADLGGDPATDLFATSGGLGGAISLPQYNGRIQDELLIGSGGTFSDAALGSGLDKGDCRGRQAAAVDVDSDGRLDLFTGCEGERPLVFRQVGDGRFRQLASPRAIGPAYEWVQLGRARSRPELLAATEKGLRVLELGGRGWKRHQSIHGKGLDGRVAQFATADVEGDGDLDVLAVGGGGNTMLRNVRGRLRAVPLKRLGLPERSVAASFVDFDNDGRLDVHLVPQGLHRGVGRGKFRRSRALGTKRAGAALTSWPDLDGDGLRDAVVSVSKAIFSKRSRVQVFRNTGPGGHWIAIDLIGAEGNRQAVGAEVTVGSGAAAQHQWVGQNDDSHFSQGHYRTYFGLGGREGVGRVLVQWPDGGSTVVNDPAVDQVFELSHP